MYRAKLSRRLMGQTFFTSIGRIPLSFSEDRLFGQKLVRAGNGCDLCQLEDPKSVKGIVKEGVTRTGYSGLSVQYDKVLRY